MGIHTTSASGMGASTISGVIITNTGMGVQDHMQVSQDLLSLGVIDPTSFYPTAAGGNLNVNVSAGTAYILNSSYSANSISQNKFFRVISDSSPQLVALLAAADSVNPRIDLICLKPTGNAPDGTASNVYTVVGSATDITLKGTPAGSPAIPATPSGYHIIAYVTISANATVINNANITDMRQIVGVSAGPGWTGLNGTFTRSSSTVINTPTNFDPTKVLQIGDKLKYYDGVVNQLNNTWTYAYIIALTSTTITVIYDSQVGTLANNPLNLYYSKDNAANFPRSLAWSPTISATGGNINLGSTGTSIGRLSMTGNMMTVVMNFVFGGTGINLQSNGYSFSLPVTGDLTVKTTGSFSGERSGVTFLGGSSVMGTTTTLQVYAVSGQLSTFVSSSITSSIPYAWAAGDKFNLTHSFYL